MKTKRIFFIVCFITFLLILAIISFRYLIVENIDDGITALEGKHQADIVANKWNSNSTLVYVRETSNMIDEGRFYKWRYKYWNGINQSDDNCIEIEVTKDKSSILRYTIRYPDVHRPIKDWIIDSNTAYNTAIKNEIIDDWLTKYKDARIDGFALYGSNANNSNPFWIIEWTSSGILDNPHNAEIEIDAKTGEILLVDVQD